MKFEKAVNEGFADSVNSLSPAERARMLSNATGASTKQPITDIVSIELRGADDQKFDRTAPSTYGDKLIISSVNHGGADVPSVRGKVIDFSKGGSLISKDSYIIANMILKGNSDFSSKLDKALMSIAANKQKYRFSPNTRPYDITYNVTSKQITVNPDI
jgi:hypothetical protein